MVQQLSIGDHPIRAYVKAALTADDEAAIAANKNLRLVGWSIRESKSAAAVATVTIQHGATQAAGTSLYHIELAADKSNEEWLWPGIPVPNGLTLDHIAGEVDVVLFYIQ